MSLTVATVHPGYVRPAMRAMELAKKQGSPAYMVMSCKAQVFAKFPGVWCHRVHADGRVDPCVISV